MRRLNFQDIRSQQLEVALRTHAEMPGLFPWIDAGISSLISALYGTAKTPDPTTVAGKVQSAVWLWTYKSVYTLSASFQLAELGYYAESLSLNRSLTETLVQILYLRRHPEESEKLPNMASGKRRKLKFATMFEEIAPGYYGSHYTWASEFAHPGWGSNAFKMTRDNTGQGAIDQGVIYKADRFTGSFNEVVMFILGFLRALAAVFPISNWDPETRSDWNDGTTDLQAALDSHIAFKGGPNSWHSLSEPMWNPK